ncbi:hypothetical protein J7E99_39765 [Streptomyces sp. ISL-44]|uniref:hypothetical protein n=1 Tax=Streptomyces sp. ISL-44 TaxID=2819184 RepID=UPI001BE889BA|nr:hypothetical protein [Streptomyces sp. ISL-44]MBT2546626.1 hypothetical protein [Streptomyces sp. ISL-44]
MVREIGAADDALERAVGVDHREPLDVAIVFALARVKQDLRQSLDAYGLTASVGTDRIYLTLPTALAAYQAWKPGAGTGAE